VASYNKDRASWAIAVQEHCAIPIYQKIWPNCMIIEIDKLGMNGDTTAQQFDFSGLDKVITINRNNIHIAQRFRKPDVNGNDFSLRYKTPGLDGIEKEAEYFILRRAFEEKVYYPNKYVFGITNNDDPSSGFRLFVIYNLSKLIETISRRSLRPVGVFPNGDGSSGIYFRLKDLQHCEEYRHLTNGQAALSLFSH